MISVFSRHLVAPVLVAVSLAGCADLPNNIDKTLEIAKQTLQGYSSSSIGASSSSSKFGQSGLKDLFNKSNLEAQWPRIAISIDSMPPRPEADVDLGNYLYPDDCFTISGVVWYSATNSKKFSNLPYCASDMPTRERINNTLRISSWSNGLFQRTIKNTGKTRTFGPNPPLKGLPPQTILYERVASRSQMLLARMLDAMGADLHVDEIPERVWIVKSVM